MTPKDTRLPDGAAQLRPESKARAYNSELACENFIARGGTLAGWYESVGVRIVPTETEQDARDRVAQRLLAACPKCLGEEQTRAWVANALRDAGASPPSLAESVEAGGIRSEFAAYCDHVRAVVDRAEADR